MRLYLPEEWAHDGKRRAAAGGPKAVRFERKWQIALSQLEEALAWGVRRHIVLADAGYGDVGSTSSNLSGYAPGRQTSQVVGNSPWASRE